jgi:hypothetical protein
MQFTQIGKSPTTSVLKQQLQLLPCAINDLYTFQAKVQTEPFFIHITRASFDLYVLLDGVYWKIPCQQYSPLDRVGYQYSVITIETDEGPLGVNYLYEIPWPVIAVQHGTPVESNTKVFKIKNPAGLQYSFGPNDSFQSSPIVSMQQQGTAFGGNRW